MTAYSVPRYADGPPRLFWRRVFAFAVDIFLFNIAVYAVLLAVTMLSPWNIGFGAIDYTECRIAPPSPLVTQVDRDWPLEFGLERTNTLCSKTALFDGTRYVFKSTTAKTKGLYTWSKWVAIESDVNGAALGPAEMRSALLVQILASGLLLSAGIGLFIYFSASGRRSPGKRLFALRVLTPYGISPGLHRATRRELLKFAPWILGSIISILTTVRAFLSPDSFGNLIAQARDMSTTNWPLSIVIVIVFGIGQLLWWLLPFLFWRGQTYYDRIVGCTVLQQDR